MSTANALMAPLLSGTGRSYFYGFDLFDVGDAMECPLHPGESMHHAQMRVTSAFLRWKKKTPDRGAIRMKSRRTRNNTIIMERIA